jgi:N-acetyl-anhydromuramyl-L-alanine amidase AmpD
MIENHLLALAKQVPSPNYNERPNDEVSLVVIHNISLPPKEFGNDKNRYSFLVLQNSIVLRAKRVCQMVQIGQSRRRV